MNQGSDRNLLLGMLALQMDFVRQADLIVAMQAWTLNKESNLEDILFEQQRIDAHTRELLGALVQKHLELHDQDPQASLAALPRDNALRDRLAEIVDSDRNATRPQLSHGGGPGSEPDVSEATLSYRGSTDDLTGRYRLLRYHAEGGLGLVSVAEDMTLHREVALKQIRPRYADIAASRQRFLIEAEVTGRLEHPGIVPVYCLGFDSAGRPFYAMRFIRGRSLKESIAAARETAQSSGRRPLQLPELRKLLKRFVDVCNAVEYAHSRGVIHRDLKPANVMLGKFGETLVVDWGLARTVERDQRHENSDESTFLPSSGDSSETRMGSVVGSPQFMSPEQAEGRLDLLGPATDVFGLGATLYCLLTGGPPYEGSSREEILSRARNWQFPPPRAIDRLIPRPLEAICLKAMARRPAQRYRSALELAEDVEQWLADEAVSAYAEPWTDRASRLARRHRTLVASGGALLVVVLVFLLVINGLVTRQNRDLRVARQTAEENLVTARGVALNIVEVAEQTLSATPGLEGFRERAMDRTYEMFERAIRQSPQDVQVVQEFAQVARMSGNLKRFLRKPLEAERRLNISLELQRRLVNDAPRDLSRSNLLAESLRDRATLLKSRGRLDEAGADLREALDIVARLQTQAPGQEELLRSEAGVELERLGLLFDLGQLEAALRSAERSVEICQSLVDSPRRGRLDPMLLLLALSSQGYLLDALGRPSEAAQVFDRAIVEARKWDEQTFDRNTSQAFARTLTWSVESAINAELTGAAGQTLEESQARLDEALRLWTNLVRAFPQSPGYRRYLADAHRVQGMLHGRKQQSELAAADLQESRTLLEALILEADEPAHRDALAKTLAELATLQAGAGQPALASQLLAAALAQLDQAIQTSPQNKELQQRRQQFQKTLEQLRSGAGGSSSSDKVPAAK